MQVFFFQKVEAKGTWIDTRKGFMPLETDLTILKTEAVFTAIPITALSYAKIFRQRHGWVPYRISRAATFDFMGSIIVPKFAPYKEQVRT